MDQNFDLRDLQEDDYERGFIDLLKELTETGNITKEMFVERYNTIKQNKDYTIRVIIDKSKNKIVGAGTLFLERKFIHLCATKGHIEDIVVDKTYRGKHFGQIIVTDLVDMSKKKDVTKRYCAVEMRLQGFMRSVNLLQRKEKW